MSNATVKSVMKQAILQVGYKETGNNHTKFGKAFGMDGVSWCAIFEWWCGYAAKGDNPIAHDASAAYIQESTVAKGGKWIMTKTRIRDTKKRGLVNAQFGDIVSFDFGKNNLYRYHTGLVIGRQGNYYLTIEGNTSSEGRGGSQSNGDQVALRLRHYTMVCSIVRPPYGKMKEYKPSESYKGREVKLPKRGYFKVGDNGVKVKRLQKALNWAVNAGVGIGSVFQNESLWGVIWFQVRNGLVPDGEFGPKSLAKLNEIIDKYKKDNTKPVQTVTAKPVTEKPVQQDTPKPAVRKQPDLYIPTEGDKCYDLSDYQGALSADYFKGIKTKGVNCVILRSSYTKLASPFRLRVDAHFHGNIKAAIKAGMHIGIYHFSSALTASESKEEAKFCIDTIKPYIEHIDLPVGYDCEFGETKDARFKAKQAKAIGKTGMGKIIDGFCSTVKSAGYEPMIYANLSMFNNYLTAEIHKKLKIWIAQYNRSCDYKHPYYMWQYTSNNGKLDEDVFGSQDTKKPPAKKSNGKKLIEKAVSFAYGYGVSEDVYSRDKGKPKKTYTEALDKIYPNHAKWKKKVRTGASCAVFVATSVKAAGLDKGFICDDPPKQYDYMVKSDKWEKVNSGLSPLPLAKLKPGDIIVYEKPGSHGDGHILFYKGNGYQVEANYNRCYPHTSKLMKAYTNETYIKNTFKRFGVFRRKG